MLQLLCKKPKELISIKARKLTAVLLAVAAFFAISALAQSSVKVYVNGKRIDEQTFLINDLTYIPLRAVAESMGAEVEWDGSSMSAFVSFSEENTVAKIVEDISPSVVTIVGNISGPDAASKYNNLTVHGSGVVYKSSGYIITNAHVVEDVKNLTVILNNGENFAGKVLYSDSSADLAVVKIDKLGLRPVSFAKAETVAAGKTAIAIGTPISLSMRNSVTKGIISGCDVTLESSHYKLIQTDAAINPGNSGGPLLNTKGELIGINTQKFVSDSVDNMSFAIPVDTVAFVIEQFEKHGQVLRPSLNIEFEESWEATLGIPTVKGLTVKSSQNPFLLKGDTVIKVNGIYVHSIIDFNEAIKDTYNGKDITVSYERGGVSAEVKIEG